MYLTSLLYTLEFGLPHIVKIRSPAFSYYSFIFKWCHILFKVTQGFDKITSQ